MGAPRTPPPPHFITDTPTYPGRTYSSLAATTTPTTASTPRTNSPTAIPPMRMGPPVLPPFTSRKLSTSSSRRFHLCTGRPDGRRSLDRLAPAATVPPLTALPQVHRGVDRLVA